MIHTLVSLAVAAALAQGAAAPAPDPLAAVNTAARAEYARAKAGLVARATPVIVVYEGDKLVLIRNGTRAERRFVPPSDADLKAVDHVPLGVFAALDALGDGPVPADRVEDLARFRAAVATARTALDARGFPAATLERQREILDASLAALDAVIKSREVHRADTARYARRMGPLVLANVSEAARAQLDGLHAAVTAWRREMSADEWHALRVVVIGVHMAREGELATQYFLRALGEAAEGRRVVYAEGLWEEPRALDLLGTHLLDGSVGAAFFGNDQRMHRDVLGDAGRSYLDELAVEP
jgi:hypothetical protein